MATGLLPFAVPETAVVTKLTIDICSKQRSFFAAGAGMLF